MRQLYHCNRQRQQEQLSSVGLVVAHKPPEVSVLREKVLHHADGTSAV